MTRTQESNAQSKLPVVDRLFKSVAERTADRYSRRSVLYSMASGVAAFLGVKFVAPAVSETWMQLAEGASLQVVTTCTHKTDCSIQGVKCGFVNSIDCDVYKNEDNCPGCYNYATGCPKGLKKGSSLWQACCHCLENAPGSKKGHWINYYDCCGGSLSLDVSCKTSKCKKHVNRNPGGCSANPGFCPIQATAPEVPWCGTTAGKPKCTFYYDTMEDCGS